MSTRTTDRFVATTHHITEGRVDVCTDIGQYGDIPLEMWPNVLQLDAALVITLRHRVQAADFSEDSF